VKDCPKCRLVSPDSALRCDCGYDFDSGAMKESYLPLKERLPAGNTASKTLTGYVGDALFMANSTYWLYKFHWMPTVLSLTLPVAYYGAILIWRWRKLIWR
jgi:hypothetical protein